MINPGVKASVFGSMTSLFCRKIPELKLRVPDRRSYLYAGPFDAAGIRVMSGFNGHGFSLKKPMRPGGQSLKNFKNDRYAVKVPMFQLNCIPDFFISDYEICGKV